ncbi:MAG TPA: hypothetical protein VIC08_01090, partial [Cellvibrionaceae bacterium]
GAGIVMWQQKAPLLFTLIAFLIGASAIIFCLHSLLLRLRVKLDTTGLHVRKSLLGLPAGSHQVHRSDITALAIKESYTAATGHNHSVFYVVQVITRSDGKITIVRNLEGRVTAEQALQSISLLTGIPGNDG